MIVALFTTVKLSGFMISPDLPTCAWRVIAPQPVDRYRLECVDSHEYTICDGVSAS